MNEIFLYIIFFFSLFGVLLIFILKTELVNKFLIKKDILMKSKVGEAAIHSTHAFGEKFKKIVKTNKNFIPSVGSWLKGKTKFKYKKDLKLLEQQKIKDSQQLEFENDNKNFEYQSLLTSNNYRSQSMQAVTVSPIVSHMSPVEVEREETRLINRVALHPQNKLYYRELGDFYIKYGKLSDAKECFRFIIRLDKDDKYAQDQLEKLGENIKLY